MNHDSSNKKPPEGKRPRAEDAFRSAKQVNKRLRQERSLLKSQRAQRDVGKLKHVLELVDARRPGDWKGQVALFLRSDIPAGKGRRRTIGDKRQTAYGSFLMNLYDDLKEARVPCQNLKEVGPKHVAPLVRLYEKRGLSEGYINDQLSIMRRFLALVGKPAAVPAGIALKELLKKHGIVAGTVGRRTIADMPKGWVDMGFEPQPIIDSMRLEAEVYACHLEMMWRFGARCNECLQLQPLDSDKGDYLVLWRGTKGKKTRMVKFSRDPEKRALQRAALDWAIAVARKNPKGELAEPGLTLEQSTKRQRYIFAKYGLTKKGLGILPHGLRHQFGTDLLRELTGLPAPVLGLLPAEVYQSKWLIMRDAYLEVSRQMGHERVSITGAYAGTPTNLGRKQNERVNELLRKVASADASLESSGVSDCWILGRAAAGMELLPGEKLQLAVRLADQSLSMNQVAPKIESVRKALEEALVEHITLTLWMEPGVPPDALETMFTPSRAGKGIDAGGASTGGGNV